VADGRRDGSAGRRCSRAHEAGPAAARFARYDLRRAFAWAESPKSGKPHLAKAAGVGLGAQSPVDIGPPKLRIVDECGEERVLAKRSLWRRFVGALRICLFHWRAAYTVPLNLLSRIMPFGTNTIQRLRGVKIGRGCIIPKEVFFDDMDPYLITLGDEVMMAPGVRIFAHVHYGARLYEYMGGRKAEPVKICDGAYLGTNVIVLKGVTIGECAVIGAGSVVTKDIPAYSLAVGAPARVVRELEKRYRRPADAIGELTLYDVFFREAVPLENEGEAAGGEDAAADGETPPDAT